MQENLTDVDWTFYPWCLQLLTNHYEQNWKYYCLPSGMGSFGTASEEELLLTKKLFWGIFDSLSHKVPQGFFGFFFSNTYWKCWKELGRQEVSEVPVSRAAEANLTRWIIYQFVTGHLFATLPPLLSSSIILFLTARLCPPHTWAADEAFFSTRRPFCVCVCRSMMLNFSKWPQHACVPSREPSPLTLWMPVWEQRWRNRRPWMHRATLTPNPSILPSE